MDLSSFVMTGAAETDWTRGWLEVDSEAEVFATAETVRREWEIQVQSPAAIACFRSILAKNLASAGAKLVSFKRIPFPHFASYSAAFRLVMNAPGRPGGASGFAREFILIWPGRTEVTLIVSGLSSQRKAISAAALRYARILSRRITR